MMTAVTVAGLVLAASSVSWGQHGQGGGHEAGHQAAGAGVAEFDKVVGEGLGFGMAFPADQAKTS
jgi:hypothetical protein